MEASLGDKESSIPQGDLAFLNHNGFIFFLSPLRST